MTSEEAIARIKEHKIIHKMGEPRAIYISEALDMAIKALQDKGHDRKNEKEISILSELRSGYSCFDKEERPYYDALSEGIRALLLAQEPCGDTITLPEEEKCKECTKLRQDKEFERSIETSFLFGTAFGFASKYDEKDKILKDIRKIIDREILDKIRAELESSTEKMWYGVENDCFMKLSDVLQIIDKYKAESEEV